MIIKERCCNIQLNTRPVPYEEDKHICIRVKDEVKRDKQNVYTNQQYRTINSPVFVTNVTKPLWTKTVSFMQLIRADCTSNA